MGFGDRHYNREDNSMYRSPRPAGGGVGAYIRMQFEGAGVTRALIILNCAIFVLGMVLFDWRGLTRLDNGFNRWGSFQVAEALGHFQLWRLLTYQFLHAGPMHLLFNMFTLFFFGPIVERWLGSRRYLAFYLIAGLSGAVGFTGLVLAKWLEPGWLVGASGSIFGLLAACAVIAPNMRVLLMGFIPMSMRTMAIAFIAIIGYNLVTQGHNAGGDAAHLGGAVIGFVLIKLPWLLNWAQRIPIGKAGGQLASPRNAGEGFFARQNSKRAENAARKQREAAARDEAEVNRILDKVKAEGMYTLTDKEKATLQRATERQRERG